MLPDVTEHTRATSFAHSIVRPLVKSLPLVCAGLKSSTSVLSLRIMIILIGPWQNGSMQDHSPVGFLCVTVNTFKG